eukprot:UN24560
MLENITKDCVAECQLKKMVRTSVSEGNDQSESLDLEAMTQTVSLKKRISELEVESSGNLDEIQLLRTQLGQGRERSLSQQEEQAQRLEDARQSYNDELNNLKKKMDRNQEQFMELGDQSAQLAKLETEIENLNQTIIDKDTRISSLLSEQEETETRHKDTIQELRETYETERRLNNTKIHENIFQKVGSMDDFKSRINRMDRRLQEERREREKLTKVIKEIRLEKREMKESYERQLKQQGLEPSVGNSSEIDEQIELLQEQIRDKSEQIYTLKDRLNARDKELIRMSKNIETFKAEYEPKGNCQNDILKLKEEHSALVRGEIEK